MNPLGFLCIVLGVLFVALFALSLNRIKRRKIIGSALYGLQGMVVFLLLILALLIFSNLNTYQRLNHENEIVDVLVRKLASQKFQLVLIYPQPDAINSEPEYYSLYGDEWQLDTRIIKWKSWANVIGLDSYYQLERLSGRYANIEQANDSPPSAHQLTGEQKGLSIWKLKNLMKSNMPFLDAYYGQSIFIPMRDGAKFRVSLSQAGLVVRPVNESATQALDAW
ncbi:hypothetical protein MnTg03_01088 [bacterium MnTg03]|nr:hypothetical protein MnTg03_01088 [bacterium MnTg03]